MPSTGLLYFFRKARLCLFSGEETPDLDASPASPGTLTKVSQHAQSGSPASCLACMRMIGCKSMDKKKLAHASSMGKQVKRQLGVMGSRNKVHDLSEAEAMAAPRRSAYNKAAIGATRMDLVAARLHRGTDEASLWRRRTQKEPLPLLID